MTTTSGAPMTAMNEAVGMMHPAYFVGRADLLTWMNDLLRLRLSKIEETASGAVACQVMDVLFPGAVQMHRINWSARSDWEFVANYKVLQAACEKVGVDRKIDVDKLVKGKYQDNLEFCQWLKQFFENNKGAAGGEEQIVEYDAVGRRALGKGVGTLKWHGNATAASVARAPSSSVARPRQPMSSVNSAAHPTATSSASASSPSSAVSAKPRISPGRVAASSSRPSSTAVAAAKSTAGSHIAHEKENHTTISSSSSGGAGAIGGSSTSSFSSSTDTRRVNDDIVARLRAELDASRAAQHTAQVESDMFMNKLHARLHDVESERDLYKGKLRNIEELLRAADPAAGPARSIANSVLLIIRDGEDLLGDSRNNDHNDSQMQTRQEAKYVASPMQPQTPERGGNDSFSRGFEEEESQSVYRHIDNSNVMESPAIHDHFADSLEE